MGTLGGCPAQTPLGVANLTLLPALLVVFNKVIQLLSRSIAFLDQILVTLIIRCEIRTFKNFHTKLYPSYLQREWGRSLKRSG